MAKINVLGKLFRRNPFPLIDLQLWGHPRVPLPDTHGLLGIQVSGPFSELLFAPYRPSISHMLWGQAMAICSHHNLGHTPAAFLSNESVENPLCP